MEHNGEYCLFLLPQQSFWTSYSMRFVRFLPINVLFVIVNVEKWKVLHCQEGQRWTQDNTAVLVSVRKVDSVHFDGSISDCESGYQSLNYWDLACMKEVNPELSFIVLVLGITKLRLPSKKLSFRAGMSLKNLSNGISSIVQKRVENHTVYPMAKVTEYFFAAPCSNMYDHDIRSTYS